jgi:hypothetical protein
MSTIRNVIPLPYARPDTIAEALGRCRERAAPFDRLVDRARAASGDEARDRTDALLHGLESTGRECWLR